MLCSTSYSVPRILVFACVVATSALASGNLDSVGVWDVESELDGLLELSPWVYQLADTENDQAMLLLTPGPKSPQWWPQTDPGVDSALGVNLSLPFAGDWFEDSGSGAGSLFLAHLDFGEPVRHNNWNVVVSTVPEPRAEVLIGLCALLFVRRILLGTLLRRLKSVA